MFIINALEDRAIGILKPVCALNAADSVHSSSAIMGVVWVTLHPDAFLQTVGEWLEPSFFSKKHFLCLPIIFLALILLSYFKIKQKSGTKPKKLYKDECGK